MIGLMTAEPTPKKKKKGGKRSGHRRDGGERMAKRLKLEGETIRIDVYISLILVWYDFLP